MKRVFVTWKLSDEEPHNGASRMSEYEALLVSATEGFLHIMEKSGKDKRTHIALDSIVMWTEEDI